MFNFFSFKTFWIWSTLFWGKGTRNNRERRGCN